MKTLENKILDITSMIDSQIKEDSYLWTYETMDEMGVSEKIQNEVSEKLFSLASAYDTGLTGVAFEYSDYALGYWGLLGCSVDEITILDYVGEMVERDFLDDNNYINTFVENFVTKFNSSVEYLQEEESKIIDSLNLDLGKA